jgi:hypothetical protein
MKIEAAAARQLALPALLAFVMVAAGAASVGVAEFYLRKARIERQAAADERRAALDKLSRATSEEREIRDKLVDYRKLLDRGVIGDEQRLDWVDTIGQIKTARRIFDIKYAISPQRRYEVPGGTSGGDVEFRVSELRLDMQLLHEEDLMGFLDDLQRQLKTHVMVRSCSMQRLDRGVSTDRNTGPRLRADCMVDLVTIRDRKLKQG